MPSLERPGENAVPIARATATALTPVIWRQRQADSKIGSVPRDREGQFHTQAFERYQRYEPHLAEGLMQMFVAGVSTRHPWEKWLKPCWASPPVPVPSVASIKRLPSNLKPGVSAACKNTGGLCTQDAGPFQHPSWGKG